VVERTGAPLLSVEFQLSPIQPNGTRKLVLDFRGDIDEPQDVVVLERVKVGFSLRWYAECPAVCGRRVRKLYVVPGSLNFACRQCAGLQHASAQAHDRRVDDCRRDAPAFWRARSNLRSLRSQYRTVTLYLEAVRRGLEVPDRLLLESMPPEIRPRVEADFATYRRRLPKRRDRRAGQGRAPAFE
jgi:hypothetical protein